MDKTPDKTPDICCICLEEFDKFVATLECNHVIHTKCLIKHVQNKNNCPLCRSLILDLSKNTDSAQISAQNSSQISAQNSSQISAQNNNNNYTQMTNIYEYINDGTWARSSINVAADRRLTQSPQNTDQIRRTLNMEEPVFTRRLSNNIYDDYDDYTFGSERMKIRCANILSNRRKNINKDYSVVCYYPIVNGRLNLSHLLMDDQSFNRIMNGYSQTLLDTITVLDICCNHITSIDVLCTVVPINLREIIFNDNYITDIHEDLAALPALKIIWCGNNRISSGTIGRFKRDNPQIIVNYDMGE